MIGKALLLLGRLGRLGNSMTVSAGNSIELMAVAQWHFPSKTCLCSFMTFLTGGASHAFRIYMTGG
jgi:hypothetical protein